MLTNKGGLLFKQIKYCIFSLYFKLMKKIIDIDLVSSNISFLQCSVLIIIISKLKLRISVICSCMCHPML